MPPYWFHLLKTDEVHVQRLLCSTYVDDIITGGETEEEAFELYVQSKQIFQEGGLNLKKFLTNSKHLQEQIDLKETQCTSSLSRDEPIYSEATLGMSHPLRTEENRDLGVPWNPASDLFFFFTLVASLSLLMTSSNKEKSC